MNRNKFVQQTEGVGDLPILVDGREVLGVHRTKTHFNVVLVPEPKKPWRRPRRRVVVEETVTVPDAVAPVVEPLVVPEPGDSE